MSKASQNQSSNHVLEAALSKWLRFSRQYRIAVIAIWSVLALIGCGLAVSLLGINTDTSDMIDANAPYRQDQIAYETVFPQADNEILVLIRADSPDAVDLFTENLSRSLSDTQDVNSIFNPELDPFFQRNGLLFLDTEELETTLTQLTEAAPLIERLTLDPSLPSLFDALAQAAEQDDDSAAGIFNAVADTLTHNLNAKRRALSWRSAFVEDLEPPFQRVLTIDPMLDNSRLRPSAVIQEAIDEHVKAIRLDTNINAQVYVTGNPVLRSDELLSVSRGIGLAFFISFILVGLLLLWALRSLILAIFTLISLVISILITAGIAALIYQELNLVSIAFTVLMVGLGVDFAIHLLLHIVHERGKGKSTSAAFYRTSRGIGTALVLTAPSTALAFLAFAPTKFVGMSQLGVVAAIGVIVAFLVATSFLPAVYSFLNRPKFRAKKQGRNIEAKRLSLIEKIRPTIAVGVIVLGLLATVLLPRAKFDADPMALRNRTAPSVVAFNKLFDRPETTPYRLNYLAPDEMAAHDAAAIFEQLDSVKSARTLQDFIPKGQADKLELIEYAAIGLEIAVSGEGEAYPIAPHPVGRLIEALEARSDLSSRRLKTALIAWQSAIAADSDLQKRTEHDLFFYWPYELERLRKQIQAREVSRKSLPATITSRYSADGGLARVEIIPKKDLRDKGLRRQFISDIARIAPQSEGTGISGSARSVQAAGDIVQRAMLQAIFAALFMVSLLLYWVVRDVKLVIIMLVPLILAGILTTASGVIFGLPYNFANVIVLPLLIGIGVDSSLHLALQSRKTGHKLSVFDTVTPRAVLFSGFTTIASFGSLTFSEHRGTSSMGALLSIAIIWVIICTVFVTPSLMNWFNRVKTSKEVIAKS